VNDCHHPHFPDGNVFATGVLVGAVLCGLVAVVLDPVLPARSPDVEERRLVFDCVSELGWEFADEEADQRTQLEQSVAWCERFAEGHLTGAMRSGSGPG